jgi:hypothetical protein
MLLMQAVNVLLVIGDTMQCSVQPLHVHMILYILCIVYKHMLYAKTIQYDVVVDYSEQRYAHPGLALIKACKLNQQVKS